MKKRLQELEIHRKIKITLQRYRHEKVIAYMTGRLDERKRVVQLIQKAFRKTGLFRNHNIADLLQEIDGKNRLKQKKQENKGDA